MNQECRDEEDEEVSDSVEEPSSPGPARGRRGAFYVIGMGGSAGSLESFESFFKAVPSDAGLAFVIVSHLDPAHKGIMPELLQRMTAMKVFQAEDGLEVLPDHVYVIPPGKDLSIQDGTLKLREPSRTRGLRLPIDFFFRQLAEDRGERSIGIIFSGMGTDGTLGLKAIKEKQGMVMVEDPGTARYDAMPRSAIGTGLVDYVEPAGELPQKLLGYVNHLARVTIVPTEPPAREAAPARELQASDALHRIFSLVRPRSRTDFGLYKESTTRRRIERRMAIHQLTDMGEYIRYIQENPGEIDLLFKEFLIGVTSFFRDPEAFEALKEEAVSRLMRKDGDSLRVWVVGCATGEEAYSIAMILRECQDHPKVRRDFKVQIYATDLDKDAIDQARQGTYPANIAADVSPERLQRFFTRLDDGRFRIRSDIRDMIVFAVQNVLTDPPFTALDLLSCRNLLIYLNPDTQKKLLSLFYYSLNAEGFLFLGSSESIGGLTDLFHAQDNKWKIFQRRANAVTRRELAEFPASLAPYSVRVHGNVMAPKEAEPNVVEVAQKLILQTIAPPVVLVNGDGDILYLTRRTGKYLEPPVGKANLNIQAMAREGLGPELGIAIRKAVTGKMRAEARGIRVRTNGSWQRVNLTVTPIDQPRSIAGLLLVQFEDVPEEDEVGPSGGGSGSRQEVVNRELELDLKATKEQLQSVMEEAQSSEEELKSANEELQSINEELQSTNEEMVTSKEELQSLNEELTTLNAELQYKNEELTQANNDMMNLLNSTQVPTIFLDEDLKIRRFTPYASSIFNLIPSDTGRPITDIASKLIYKEMVHDVGDVLKTLVPKDVQVQTENGLWYHMRIIPYRTVNNIIDGVVITFSDITNLKRLEVALRENEEESFVRQVLDRWPGATFIFDLEKNRNIFVSQSASSMLGYPRDLLDSAGSDFWSSIYHPDDAARLADQDLWLASAREDDILQVEYRMKRADGQWRWFKERTTVLSWAPDHRPTRVLRVLEDITEEKRALEMQESLFGVTMHAEYAEEILRTVREPMAVLDGDLSVAFANPAFYSAFRTAPEDTMGRHIYDLGNGQWDIPELRRLLEEIIPKSAKIEDYIVEHDFPGMGQRSMLINARRIGEDEAEKKLILLAIEDVTNRNDTSSNDRGRSNAE